MHLLQRMANRQIFWSYLAVRGLSHATQQHYQLDVIDGLLAKQGDQVCCRVSCMHACTPRL